MIPHSTPISEILKSFSVNEKDGLSKEQVSERLEKHGQNKLKEKKKIRLRDAAAVTVSEKADELQKKLGGGLSFFKNMFKKKKKDPPPDVPGPGEELPV